VTRAETVEVEATGETVGEAKWSALRELERLRPGIDKAAVRFQVVSEGERGLLGVGYAPARVVASAPDVEAAAEPEPEPGPVGEGEQAAEVRDVLEHIVRAVGVRARIEIVEGEEAVTATLVGPELGLLIGKHGQTIDAMQYLANAAVWRGRGDERKAVVVDAAGYRARREATLASLAQRSAERAVSSARSVELDPMTAVERKVVHVCLKEYPGVVTRSEGTEPNRFVVIDPV
jgi:spoIIIJ-associated protein